MRHPPHSQAIATAEARSDADRQRRAIASATATLAAISTSDTAIGPPISAVCMSDGVSCTTPA
jgi:hypothetical protein